MSPLGFQDWVNSYAHIASAAKRLTYLYFLSLITLFVICIADGAWSRSSVFNYESLMRIYQVYKTSNITEYLRVIWKLILW